MRGGLARRALGAPTPDRKRLTSSCSRGSGERQDQSADVRWGALAQFFHWTIVVLIITQFVLALYAEDLHGMKKLAVLATHKSIGITILMLAVLRVLWRLFNPIPALPTSPTTT